MVDNYCVMRFFPPQPEHPMLVCSLSKSSINMFYFYKILFRILASASLLIACKYKIQIKKPQYTLPVFHSIKLSQYILSVFHSIKPSQYTLPVFFIGLSFILSSCTSVPIERETPKQPDPVKQEECKKTGKGDCKESCEDRCDDVFDKESHQKKCYEYSAELVSDFEDLITATERGKINDIEDIGHDVLNCMLDIDEQGFAKAVREMSRGGAEEFALLIANDKDFAAVLEEEDDEFNVLKQLLNRLAGSSNLYRGLSREIEDGKTLLWLFAESNERAWKWLDNYIEEECDGEDSDDCPGGENIGAYCKALTESGFSRTEWEEFLSEAELFEKNYASEVKDAEYEYKITSSHDSDSEGDFRDFCFLTAGTSSSGASSSGASSSGSSSGTSSGSSSGGSSGGSGSSSSSSSSSGSSSGASSSGSSSSGSSSGGSGGGAPGPDTENVCGRTEQVKNKIESLTGKSCADVTSADLASIGTEPGADGLLAIGGGITSLQAGDFAGLSTIRSLHITGNPQLTTLPVDLFDAGDLPKLDLLSFANNGLSSLPEDVFQPIRRRIASLQLQNNQLTTLPEDLFDGMTGLEFLYLQNNQLTRLHDNLFEGLSLLSEIYLSGNSLSDDHETLWGRRLGGKLIGGW